MNALPQTARATVNCRVLPGEPIAEVEPTLKRVLADDRISITPFGMPVSSTPSELHGEVMAAIEKLATPAFPPTAIPVSPTTWTTSGRMGRTSACP